MKDNFGEFLHIADPVFADPPGKDLIYNFAVSFRDDIENKIIQEIIKEAKAEGITDVVLLNKPAIIGALRKQTAMKPKIRKFGFKSVYYACPCCEQRLISKIDGEFIAGQKYNHCYKCGQKLDWSEEE